MEAVIDGLHSRFGTVAVQVAQGGRLRAMEQDERPVLFMGQRPFVIRRILGAKVHQPQRMIGILHGPLELPQGEPADAAMIKLHELPVDLDTLLLAQLKAVAFVQCAADQVIVDGLFALGARAVGASLGFQLQDPHLNAHLDHVPTVFSLNDPNAYTFRFIGPVTKDVVNVLVSCHAVQKVSRKALAHGPPGRLPAKKWDLASGRSWCFYYTFRFAECRGGAARPPQHVPSQQRPNYRADD